MSDDDYYFRIDLAGGLEPVLVRYQLTAVSLAWDGQAFQHISFTPKPDAFVEANAARAVKDRIDSELANTYKENAGVAFRFMLDLEKDTSELTWGLED